MGWYRNMKKEDLIKRAAAQGITLTEEQAEKYINLSDEELANIAGGGSGPCRNDRRVLDGNEAPNCPYYKDAQPIPSHAVHCGFCEYTRYLVNDNGIWTNYCFNTATFK
jgi:bacteriocin-like protein